MKDFFLQYQQIDQATWAYLSSMLMIGLYFKFGRLWSVRNLDLLLLILLAPGLLYVYQGQKLQQPAPVEEAMVQNADPPGDHQSEEPSTDASDLNTNANADDLPDPPLDHGSSGAIPDSIPREETPPEEEDRITTPETPESSSEESPLSHPSPSSAYAISDEAESRGMQIERLGFSWLLAAAGLLLIRALFDATMVRRPLLEPNLLLGGLAFLGSLLFIFISANIYLSSPTQNDLRIDQGVGALAARGDGSIDIKAYGPGYPPLRSLPGIPAQTPEDLREGDSPEQMESSLLVKMAKMIAILSQLAIILGIVFIGFRHFDNLRMGIGAAALYLLLPSTVQMSGQVDHLLPAALLIWVIGSYRWPMVAGFFLGLAGGVIYYPMFLLPLWMSFYWRRGLYRFLLGIGTGLGILVISLLFFDSPDFGFLDQVRQMFGLWFPVTEGLAGIWNLDAGGLDPAYRIPVLAVFVILSISVAIWPAHKNLGTLISCSAAVMIGAQFWHGFGGGVYMAWYTPLLLLMIFRPNLEDRVALTVLSQGWSSTRKQEERSSIGKKMA